MTYEMDDYEEEWDLDSCAVLDDVVQDVEHLRERLDKAEVLLRRVQFHLRNPEMTQIKSLKSEVEAWMKGVK